MNTEVSVPWAPRSSVTMISQSTEYGYSYDCPLSLGLTKLHTIRGKETIFYMVKTVLMVR
jgi:hypothetical protein